MLLSVRVIEFPLSDLACVGVQRIILNGSKVISFLVLFLLWTTRWAITARFKVLLSSQFAFYQFAFVLWYLYFGLLFEHLYIWWLFLMLRLFYDLYHFRLLLILFIVICQHPRIVSITVRWNLVYAEFGIDLNQALFLNLLGALVRIECLVIRI